MIDGDTLVIGEVHVRLDAIDAPESTQTCTSRFGTPWPCGAAATSRLTGLIADHDVRCDSLGADRYGRMLGICYVGALELNDEMVRSGLAWAFVKYSTRLVEAEAVARAARAGIWQGEATPAWTYRAERWNRAAEQIRAVDALHAGAAPVAGAPTESQQGCVIKGNVTRNGNIYHMPWSRWYERTRIDTARGERWFCTEAEAQAAGWRPALTQ